MWSVVNMNAMRGGTRCYIHVSKCQSGLKGPEGCRGSACPNPRFSRARPRGRSALSVGGGDSGEEMRRLFLGNQGAKHDGRGLRDWGEASDRLRHSCILGPPNKKR